MLDIVPVCHIHHVHSNKIKFELGWALVSGFFKFIQLTLK